MVPLVNFRGNVRPVLLAGSAGYISRALKAAELFRTELRLRGVSVVPTQLSSKAKPHQNQSGRMSAAARCYTSQP
jgi:hypothetical protein